MTHSKLQRLNQKVIIALSVRDTTNGRSRDFLRFLPDFLTTDAVGVPDTADTSTPKAEGTREPDLSEAAELSRATVGLSQSFKRGVDTTPPHHDKSAATPDNLRISSWRRCIKSTASAPTVPSPPKVDSRAALMKPATWCSNLSIMASRDSCDEERTLESAKHGKPHYHLQWTIIRASLYEQRDTIPDPML